LADVTAGRFREDLFYRLHVFPIAVPPLRERAEDVPELARHFVARFAAEEGKRIRTLAPEAVAALRAQGWPGNVRQLENTMFRAVVLAEADTIGLAELPQLGAQIAVACAVDAAPLLVEPCAAAVPVAPAASHEPAQHAAANFSAAALNPLPLFDDQGHIRPIEDIEADVIRFAIAHYRGQMSEVARRLQIGRSTLYRKLESLDPALSAPDPDRDAVAAG
jgi:DNA-binding NtrC family response regulator